MPPHVTTWIVVVRVHSTTNNVLAASKDKMPLIDAPTTAKNPLIFLDPFRFYIVFYKSFVVLHTILELEVV